MPAVDVGTGNAVAVSYYQSERVANENTTPTGGFAPCNVTPQPTPCQADVRTKPSSYWLSGQQESAPQT